MNAILYYLRDNFMPAVIHRTGTYVGLFLSQLGMASDDISTVVAAIPAILGLLVDTVIRKIV